KLSGEISGRIHSTSTNNPSIRQSIRIPEGHKVYVKAHAKILETDVAPSLIIGKLENHWDAVEEITFDKTLETWQEISEVITNDGLGLYLFFVVRGREIKSTVHFDDITVIDLTQTFGKGKEPTKKEIEALVKEISWQNEYQVRLKDILLDSLLNKPQALAKFDTTKTEKVEGIPLYGAAGLTVHVDVMARGNLSVSASDDGEHYNKLKL